MEAIAAGAPPAAPGPVAPPRPVPARRYGPSQPGRVTLSRAQLLINQRISQAAVRRVNAILAELAGGLTGANVRDGSLGRATLAPALQAGG